MPKGPGVQAHTSPAGGPSLKGPAGSFRPDPAAQKGGTNCPIWAAPGGPKGVGPTGPLGPDPAGQKGGGQLGKLLGEIGPKKFAPKASKPPLQPPPRNSDF